MTDDQRERYEERAAIMEYDGGMSRQDAERAALSISASHTPSHQEVVVDSPKKEGIHGSPS